MLASVVTGWWGVGVGGVCRGGGGWGVPGWGGGGFKRAEPFIEPMSCPDCD